MGSGDSDDVMTMDCERAAELLPWYANGSLDEEERTAVSTHLEGCALCRVELEATVRMAWITERHLPVDRLTEYAFGAELPAEERAVLERHLAHCERCRDELRSAREVADLPLENVGAARPVSRGPWAPLALAASLAAVLFGALWWSSISTTAPVPEANVALVELLPESLVLRGGTGSPDVAEGPVTVVLVTELALPEGDYRARLVAGEGDPIWTVEGLRPGSDGLFGLHLPGGLEVPAGSRILLETRDGEGWRTLETYPVGDRGP